MLLYSDTIVKWTVCVKKWDVVFITIGAIMSELEFYKVMTKTIGFLHIQAVKMTKLCAKTSGQQNSGSFPPNNIPPEEITFNYSSFVSRGPQQF